jgi:hypothetical protein
VVPSPSVNSMYLLDRPAMVSALLGWTSSGSPNLLSDEIESEKLFPTGDSERSSRLL